MKRKILGSFLIIAFTLGITLATYDYKSKFLEKTIPEQEEKKGISVFIEKQYPYITIDNQKKVKNTETGEILYDPTVEYTEQEPEKIVILQEEIKMERGNNIYEYLKYFFWTFPEQTKESFSKEDKDMIISLASQIYEPRSSAYVKKVAKQYFGIKNYELPTGLYDIADFGEYTILKQDDYYIRSSVKNFKEYKKYVPFLTNTKIEGNKIYLAFDYAEGGENGGCYQEGITEDEKKECRVGWYDFELIYNEEENSLIVEKIKYTKK